MQLTLLGNLSKTKGLKTAQDVAGFIGALHPQTRELLTDVEKLIELCLCLPVSAASSERSFSTLRRLKTWLRSNMTQRRLTHLAIMHVHSDILDRMDIQPLMKRFIDNTPERKSTFGFFKIKRKQDIMSFFAPKKINDEADSNTESQTQQEVQIATEGEPEDFSGETELEIEGSEAEQGEKDEESQSEADACQQDHASYCQGGDDPQPALVHHPPSNPDGFSPCLFGGGGACREKFPCSSLQLAG
ncbi:hypothetical protein F7725_024567 [Dissostichus mawsoni]|uniref:HAT C-terminal dimerisation domain-containing protein n=1 Tax=Dissostichus mawsoni TaxID=36200 RepID=A0A7J5XZR4_DISMA|nr:hypothetical protein F7725_024567 [Dissostichus mawsoni]